MVVSAFSAMIFLPIIIKQNQFKVIAKYYKEITLLGVIIVVRSVLQWTAASMTLLVYVLAVKRLSALTTVIGSFIWLKEPVSAQRIISACLMVAGVVLIVLFS